MKPRQTLLPTQVDLLVARLGKWFVWRRRTLLRQVQIYLAQAESTYSLLSTRHHKLQAKSAMLREQSRRESARADATTSTLARTQITLDATKSAYGCLSTRHRRLQAKAAMLRQCSRREAERANDLQERYGLVSQLLAAKPALDGGITPFRKAIEDYYLPFTREESSLADEAMASRKIESIEAQLELIINAPGIHARRIISIAGGFSSGKSAFINSFIESPEIALAVGMRPVTAIPTYVWSAPESAIKAHAKAGGAVEMDTALFNKISHAFLKSIDFDLKAIMPFISIATPMMTPYFEHLCLLDTPGYNPPRTDGYTGGDFTTASAFSTQGHAVIWLIGLDATGTLVASDLDFIRGLDLEGKELYVVANKADLRASSDVEAILDDIEELLADEGIATVGVSAFSAHSKREYAFRGQSLYTFFERHDEPVDAREELYEAIDEVFAMYREAIAQDIAGVIQSRRTFKSMDLDLQQHASDELISLINTKFTSLKHEDKEARLRDHLRSAGVVKERMKTSVHETLCAAAVELRCGLEDAGQFVDTTFENIDEILSGLRNEDYSRAERFERIEDEPVAGDDARESNAGAARGWFSKNGVFRWLTAGGNQ